ncbi:DUF58 domain-containing protein [Cohnella endophytica]|uniref:DUF58 domain-containing protein n=1 Tax=Cohnella endophytica TaxID=2419778 RepID=A0A494XHF4_9BACL|nr:DUF58 domain-containing protein [Cohnella endophytica]RKP48036.1 DUF58 domain-containing protein [Cohnella endophytica]
MAVLVWVILLMTALYALQRTVYRFAGLKSVTYVRTFSASRLFAGQTIWMQETLANRKRLPLPWLRVESLLPAQLVFKHREADMSIHSGDRLQNHASLFSVPSYTEIVRKHEIVLPYRGKYRITSYTLTFGDLVGLTGKSVQQSADNELIVYPRLKQLSEFPLEARKYLQSVRSRVSPIREDHYFVAGIRPYRHGDSFRMVNWNATAKTGELLVHQRESMQDNDLTIILNAELLDSAHNVRISPEEFEKALSYAASAAQYVISGGGRAGFIYNGVTDGHEGSVFRAPAKSGAAHMDMLLEAMAGFQPVTTLGLSFLLEQLVAERQRGMNALLVTAYLDPKQEMLVRRLRGQGNTVELLKLGKGANV